VPAEDRVKVLDHIRFSPDNHRLHANLQQDRNGEARRHDHRHLACRRAADGAVGRTSRFPSRCLGSVPRRPTSTFGKDTNDASDGVLYQGVLRPRCCGDAEVDSVLGRVQGEVRQTILPMPAYTSYERSLLHCRRGEGGGSTEADKLVDALEKTDWVGTIGRVQFTAKTTSYAFAEIRQGSAHRLDVAMAGRQAGQRLAEGSRQRSVEVPSFIKFTSN